MNEAQASGRRTLILISLIFAIPIVAAMYMYFSGAALQPSGSTERGELIAPPRTLPDAPLNAEDERFRKIWSLVVLADMECDALCISTLENTRQIRLSLGPKMTRMQTVFLPADDAATRPEFPEQHPKLIVVKPASSAEMRAIIGDYRNGEIFIVDPLGNLMMRYEPGADMGDIRKDVIHLFKLSSIG